MERSALSQAWLRKVRRSGRDQLATASRPDQVARETTHLVRHRRRRGYLHSPIKSNAPVHEIRPRYGRLLPALPQVAPVRALVRRTRSHVRVGLPHCPPPPPHSEDGAPETYINRVALRRDRNLASCTAAQLAIPPWSLATAGTSRENWMYSGSSCQMSRLNRIDKTVVRDCQQKTQASNSYSAGNSCGHMCGFA